MTVTPEQLQAAALDLRHQASEITGTVENAVLLVTAAAIRKGDVDDQITKAVAAERERCAQIIRELLDAGADLMNEMHALIAHPPAELAADGRWELAEAAATDLVRQEAGT